MSLALPLDSVPPRLPRWPDDWHDRRDPPALTPVLAVRDLSKRFQLHLRGGLSLPVLADEALDLHAGECVALTGPSGTGKSTLMKCIWGSYHCDSGSIMLNAGCGSEAPAGGLPGIDLARAPARTLLRLRLTVMAHVSQFLRVLPRLPALDIVAQAAMDAEQTLGLHPDESLCLPAAATARPGLPTLLDDPLHHQRLTLARSQAARLLARLNLPRELWMLPPATFSGGEQQRVNIARAFVRPARLLLLDEPTASLDARNRAVVMALIEEAKAAGTAVLGIFHDEEVRERVASRLHALEPVRPALRALPGAAASPVRIAPMGAQP